MAQVQETIPEALRPEVEASLSWFNAREGTPFEVTGILDPDQSLAASGERELRLILCGGDRCEQRSFRVTPSGGDFQVSLVGDDDGAPDASQAELDPPPGALRGWLDRALGQHDFLVLLFYRGYW